MGAEDPPTDVVTVGRLGKPNGLEGFLGLYVDDADLVHFEPGSDVIIDDSHLTVRAVRPGKKGPQVAFEGVTDREEAERLRGRDVRVRSRRQLEDDEFWPEDLVGLQVRPGGGEIVAVSHGAAQDRLVVQREGSSFEVPFVDELVPVIDLERGYVEIVEIEGLSQPPDPR